MTAKTILIADDDMSIRTVLGHALRREGFDVETTDNGATLYQWVLEGRGDLVITDVMMPGVNGLDLVPKIRARRPAMKVIVMSAQNALTTAVTAAERGALDFLSKPFDVDDLISMVRDALRVRAPDQDNAAEAKTAQALDKSFVIGTSRAMQDIYRTIARLHASDLTVLITGESGTGKEVVARALHAFSHRKSGAFVAVNMAAIPAELIESELFGHEKGAFTGAHARAAGRFEQARGGTLFLDEIGDMPHAAQTRLLRVLQEGEFTTVGGSKVIKADTRIVAATNKDIRALIRKGLFREDLYYRLNVIPIAVPPLRDRRGDIPDLVRHFLRGTTRVFDREAMTLLQEAPWQGNIRELENVVRRLSALSAADIIDADSVRTELTASQQGAIAADDFADIGQSFSRLVDACLANGMTEGAVYDDLLRRLEKPLIEKILSQTGGNQIRSAEILGMNRNTLRKKIRDLEIDVRKK